jgi:hypothetical protein
MKKTDAKPNVLFEATVKNMLNTPPTPRKPTLKPKIKKKTGTMAGLK